MVIFQWLYLHFHWSRKDTCQKCDFLKLKIEACADECEKWQLKLEHDLHLRSAEFARRCLEYQKKAAENSDEYFAFLSDFQKALQFPRT